MIDYYFRIQRTQHLARLCANNGYTVFHLRTSVNTRSKQINVKEILPNLYEINLWCQTNRKISVYDTILNECEIKSMADCIECIKKQYMFEHFVSYIANPFWIQLVNTLINTSKIFDCLDYTKEFNTHDNYILNLEKDFINNEYTIFTTPILREVMEHDNRNYSIIRNGCEFAYFNSIKKNTKKNKKIVGYYGAISDWWDVDLVEKLILDLPEVDFHFIGNIAGNNQNHIDKIKKFKDANYSNVIFFGEIPYCDLSSYLSKFDVGIIPFILNELIKCTNPVKLYEMFSFGLPVVLTELEDVVKLDISDICYISKDINKFNINLQNALNENDLDKRIKRIEYAKNNTWNNRFEQFETVIKTLTPYISIVLLCYNNWNITKKCIDSVLENSNYLFYELIIVNNNSLDETKIELDKLYKNNEKIRIINNKENYGFAMGMNIGALHASYDYIILLNNDTIVSKDWIYPLVKPLIFNNYGMGSPITNNCGNEVKQFISFKDENDLMIKAKKIQNVNNYKTVEIDRIPFFSPIIRKNDFYSIGMLDINYKFGGWEDDDIIYKLKLFKNVPNYYTFGSFVYHMESVTMSQVNNKKNWTQDNKNKEYYESKWKVKWIPPKYNISTINIQTNFILAIELLNKSISNQKAFNLNIIDNVKNVIIIKETCQGKLLNNEIYMHIINNNIVLKNKYETIILNKLDIINIYSFINTLLYTIQN